LKNPCASFWARRVNRHGCPVDPARSCRQPGGPATGAGSPGAALLATGSPGHPCRVARPPCWAYKSPWPAAPSTLKHSHSFQIAAAGP
jgi:hypothetical protein